MFMLFAMMAVPFVLFMFLDQIALMLILVPIYQPIIKIYQFDDIWFWTLFLIVATVGGLTPPFGYVLFALKSAAPDVPIQVIYRASWPFVWIITLGMVRLRNIPRPDHLAAAADGGSLAPSAQAKICAFDRGRCLPSRLSDSAGRTGLAKRRIPHSPIYDRRCRGDGLSCDRRHIS